MSTGGKTDASDLIRNNAEFFRMRPDETHRTDPIGMGGLFPVGTTVFQYKSGKTVEVEKTGDIRSFLVPGKMMVAAPRTDQHCRMRSRAGCRIEGQSRFRHIGVTVVIVAHIRLQMFLKPGIILA